MPPTFIQQIVDPLSRSFTPEAAEEIVRFRVDDKTQERIDELADKCTEGTLTADERTEYQEFVSYFNILSVLQARARTYLQAHGGL